ncbi:predicted protein [Naegleria gruberi]|uniref:Lipoamide acyltransferase component of branched-chain alpha-keto acid dehydrogenase complex, mitochondrial n=1 Tax=Naegleria gruberi TaxID=5762 RepID=D2VYV8_NAEGR|nr:uncharacterized protein NAEGRDRAFT_81755 [Naegleria gruberi]EFC37978.1 predicted protein [Naegleria gruberi]|eukprot:XP_002670722.1 predicted protein [Naegleria gruberi strain NEG-M]
MNNTLQEEQQQQQEQIEILPITVPRVGEGISTLQITKWHKQIGDLVDYGDALVEMKASQLSIDIYAERRGIMKEHLMREGEYAHVGDVVSYLQVERMNSEEVKKDIEGIMTKTDMTAKKKIDSRDLIIAIIVLIGFFFDDFLKLVMNCFDYLFNEN